MMKRSMMSRMLAYLLTLAMTVTSIPMKAFAESEQQASEQASEESSVLEQLADENTNYYEVEFGMPEGITNEAFAEIQIPESQMVPEGTLVYGLPEATWEEHEFLGWAYDPQLTQRAEGEDAIMKNLTLYPSFTDLQHFDDEFRINYVSEEQVEPDYEIRISVHGLLENQVRENLAVRNLSTINSEEEFVIERIAPDLTELIQDAETLSQVQEILTQFEAGELESGLLEALQGLKGEAAEPATEQGSEAGTEQGSGQEEPEQLLDDIVIYELAA